MASAGVFALLQAVAFIKYIQTYLTKKEFKYFFFTAGAVAAALVFLTVVGLTWAGVIAPWSGRFYSLWDTGYAKIHIPIIASVSEHQPTTWASFFFDLHVLIAVFPAGVWFISKKIDDARVFLILYGVFGSYFAGVMVMLMLTLTPCVCMVAGIAFTEMLTPFFENMFDYETDKLQSSIQEAKDRAGVAKKKSKVAQDLTDKEAS